MASVKARVNAAITVAALAAIPFCAYFGNWFWMAYCMTVVLISILEFLKKWFYLQRGMLLLVLTANILNYWDGSDPIFEWTVIAVFLSVSIVVMAKNPKPQEHQVAKV